MDWQWLLLLLCQILSEVENKEVIAQINTKKLMQYVPERFLSMTIDPSSLFLAGKLEEQALKMARGLYPSFVRLGGKATNHLKFGKELFVDNNTITEAQWDGVNEFVRRAGLDLIVSLNPTHRVQGVWDSRDALQLISYSDKNGYNIAWQLGYDTEGHLAPGVEVGRDIIRLRKILDGFQRYAKTPLFGPDLSDTHSIKEANFIRDMLAQAGPVLGAIFIQMPFSAQEDPSNTISNTLSNLDNLIWSRELRYGRIIPKKPVWLTEQCPSSGSIEDAFSLLKHLGIAAKMGCQVVLRQVGPESLQYPTPDYWMALMYKNLVGRGVFEAKVNPGNVSEITLFSHCSQSLPQEKSILDTGFNYEKGGVTVFGVNESPETIKLFLKASMKDEKAHLYILTFQDDPNGKIGKTFLNGQLLSLSPSGDIPIVSPRIKRTIKYGVNVPARSIFFIVLPDLKARTCSLSSPFVSPDVQSLSKKLIHVVADALEKPCNEELKSEEEDPQKVYVKFTKSIGPQSPSVINHKSLVEDDSEPDVQVKYITFNDNSWLSKLAETMGNKNTFEQVENKNNENEEGKYSELYAAVTGELDNTNQSVSVEPENKMRRKRSADDSSTDSATDPDSATNKSVVSEEDLVKHLNQYANAIYETSRAEDSNKDVEIANIPQKILDALKTVKVTFKNLGKDDTQKETTDGTNKNEPSQEGPVEEEKDAAPLNNYLVNSDGSVDQVESDAEKTNAYSQLNRNKDLDIYKENIVESNKRVAKEISEREQKSVEESTAQESNDRNSINLDTFTISEPSQSKDSYLIPSSKPQSESSLEITDKSREEVKSENEQKYADIENGSLQLADLKSEIENQDNNEYPPKTQNTGISEIDENLKNDNIQPDNSISERKESVNDPKELENNFDLKSTEIVSPLSQDNLLEPDKSIVLIPIKSVESAEIPNAVQVEGAEQQTSDLLTTQSEYKKKESADENNDTEYSSLNQNSILHNEEDETEKLVQTDEIKENKSAANDLLPEVLYSTENEAAKINTHKFDGEQTLSNEPDLLLQPVMISGVASDSRKDNLNPDSSSSSDGTNYSSLVVPPANENQQQGLQGGPPLPLDSLDSVKVQREIPLNQDVSENNVPNVPLLMVPISSEQIPSHEDIKDEIKNENSFDNFNIDTSNGQDSADLSGSDNINKHILDLSSNIRDRKDISESSNNEAVPDSPSNAAENVNSETQVAPMGNLPLENSLDKTYIKIPDPSVSDNQENLSNADSELSSEQTKGEIQSIESISNDYLDKSSTSKISQVAEIPMLIPVASQETKFPVEKTSYTDEQHSLEPQVVPLQIAEEKIETDEQNIGYEKNTENIKNNGERNIYHYNLLGKSIPDIENNDSNSPDFSHKSDTAKADIEKERRERLLSLRKQIMEMREQFRAQVKEEGLKAALQRREEGMRHYLNHDKELRKKLIPYPLVTQDHSVLSRPRRLTYFPESDLSEEEQYDYIDQKLFKKKSDSYGMPILGGYDKPFLQQQTIQSPSYNIDRNHILFPLDPKTPQAVVYDDRIIPAKLFGIISVDGEQPPQVKSSTIGNKPIVDIPIDSVYQKYYAKHYNPQPYINEKPIARIPDTSLPLQTYPLPRDAFIKTLDEPSNYIPIVVLSSHAKNRRKRSLTQDNTRMKKSAKDGNNNQKTGLKKRSIESMSPLDKSNALIDSSYDFLNEIPNEKENNINSIEYLHPNEIILQKRNDVNSNQFSKKFPEFLPSNGVPLSFIHTSPNVYNNPPIWDDGGHVVEPRTFIESHPLPPHPFPHPPPPSLYVHHDVPEQHSDKQEDSPKFFFWSIIHDKFKSMLALLQSLAEWCTSSTDK